MEIGCGVLFSLKSFAIVDALRLMAPMLDGFASSSLFEATLAREVIENTGTVHITTPSFRPDEINDLAETCDYISFNSLAQWNRFRAIVGGRARCGLRVNPHLSFVKDDRYNPCRKHSKLGVPLNALTNALSNGLGELGHVTGIHCHTNCESTTLDPLLATVQYLDLHLASLLPRLEWINLGGGYQYDEIDSLEPLYQAVDLLQRKYGLEVFIEPGEAIVGNAGYVISSVVDLFDSEGKTLAILDTSINHMPQVYEYQYRPDVSNSNQSGKHGYVLAGATCLAGDIFGEYNFDAPLEIGSKVIFEFMGAYTLVKAHMFNGVSLPSIYALNDKNELLLKKQYTFDDYISRWKEPAAYETV
jgi:carboxynorspermidine decarboxylase